jgi:hypothetical protein
MTLIDAAWDVGFGTFQLRRRAELTPDQEGRAARLRLTIETRARGPMKLLVPLLRGRFRRTMDRSPRAVVTLIEGNDSAESSHR